MNISRISLIVLIVLFFFGESLFNNAVKNIVPFPNSVNIVKEKPSEEYITKTKDIASLISEKDKLDICLVNYEFSKRVQGYLNQNVTGQQINDLYAQVNRDYFKGSLSGKYNVFADKIEKLFIEVVGKDQSKLTEDQLRQLNRYMLALSWNLQ